MIFVILAAICDALIDTLAHHWYKFRWKDDVSEQWWNPAISWKNKYEVNLPTQLTDAFHFFKTLKITFWLLAVITFNPIINPAADLVLLGIVRNITFSLFYDKLFVR